MKDVKQDLTDRLLLLRSRYEVAFHTTDATGNREIELYAGVIEKGLHDGLESAMNAVRAIVDPADLSNATFWRSPLGVLFFAAGGYPRPWLSQTDTAGILGCSRQYVHEMLVSGRLQRPAGHRSLVDAGSVRESLRRKLDRFVN